jgi:hypothetical protein
MAAADCIESAIAVAPTGHDRISLVVCVSAAGSEKRNPAKAGIKFVHFGGILQTAGDRGGSGSRLASPCPVRRAPGARGSNRDINCNLPTGVATLRIVHQQSGARVRARCPGRSNCRSHQEPAWLNAMRDVAHRRALSNTCPAGNGGGRSIPCALHGCAQIGCSRKYLINTSMKLRTLAGTCWRCG